MTVFQRQEGGAYYAKFRVKGRQYLLSTQSTVKRDAEAKARQLRSDVLAERWEELEAKKVRQARFANLGELFTAYRRHAGDVKPYVQRRNIQILRTIIRQARPTHDKAPDNEIDALSTSILTASLLSDYKRIRLEAAGENGLAQQTAKITANACRRQARAIFKREVLPLYKDLSLPDLTGFLGVPAFKVEKKGFRFDAEALGRSRAAAAQLRLDDANAYRIFLLALGAGLRKGEIAHGRWSWIEGDAKRGYSIRIQATEDWSGPKGKREREVPLEPIVVDQLTQLRTQVGDTHLLEGCKTERCDQAFRRFADWLKGQGWEGRKAAHTLRKVYGSLVAAQHGLKAAQTVLGHADISTTADIYVGLTKTPTVTIFGA